MDTSKQILVIPKFVFHVRTIARTKDSPGSMTTSAKTSIYTPTPRIRHPMRRYTIFMMYASGLTQEKRIMVRSIKYPNMMDTGIWRMCSNLKFFLRIINCSTIRKILKKMVKFPSVNGKLRLNTFGILYKKVCYFYFNLHKTVWHSNDNTVWKISIFCSIIKSHSVTATISNTIHIPKGTSHFRLIFILISSNIVPLTW